MKVALFITGLLCTTVIAPVVFITAGFRKTREFIIDTTRTTRAHIEKLG
jgi:uncharacterized membrane protein